MSDTPDIAKIVSLIMENPGLVSQIADMANSHTESEKDEAVTTAPHTAESAEAVSASVAPHEESRRVHRMRLAAAMKPYLSTERAQAIDAMMSIVDILEVVRGKQ